MLEKENLLSMSHNAMIPLPFLTASTEAEIMCIVDVKGNIREREREQIFVRNLSHKLQIYVKYVSEIINLSENCQ